ncbi:MAG TPA: Flp family type IVb pilin [Aestuariivirga sp.]|jgi:Flp pilus assembly pilin Flp|nr:Flp family type IVb pilin [Hyphomicrobiales bacterium]HQX84026.1 Flp family type IVb pilin [Aestuariivirga sp.]MBP9174814.1 Flp family type IVb pilin [Hyphomicrobiales bacterium]MBZ0262173.1 Flp family type IVb pilin [Hyphomicrobiales bacterium]MCC7482051.1 Flp family type IVb pilin [Hyphomicrobiales bacterium]
MKNAKYLAKLFVRDASGATAIEYGLIAAAMGLMLIPVMFSLSSTVKVTLFDVMVGLFPT